MTISLIDIPENVLADIFRKCGFLSIFVLRKVCSQFRNFIDDVKPCIEVNAGIRKISLRMNSYHFRSSAYVKYEDHPKGCVVSYYKQEMKLPPPLPPLQSRPVPEWAQRSGKYSPVPTYNGPKLKECILEGVELMDAFSNDFQAVIGAQRSKTEFFRVHLVCLRPPPCPTRSFPMTRSINTNQRPYGNVIPYTMLSYFETREKFVFRFLNALEQTLQSRKQLLKVENCSMEVIKCEQLLQILPNIDSKYLKSIEISSPKICPHEEFEMDRLVTSNQWRKAKTFDLRSFYVSTPINNFLHFNSAKFHIHSVCCEDLKTMQQVFINSSNFESFEIGYNNFEGRENLIQTFGEAETNGRWYFWIFPIPQSENVLFLNVILCHPHIICFTRCPESTPPQKGCVNCHYSY
ncbi:hypothetical protein L5515_009037 [Caenorhabditis briggsae]|uniref:F-box domain-containing protein n=1 Tax=Caenorhabditis briggsae TaxID=6238 RepID=A0AAE9F7S9_CAEBR|nr:hypothetical protein L5515_009037 [Caenorhabditis briggsae]